MFDLSGIIAPFLKLIPDTNERAKAKETIEAQIQLAIAQENQGQIEINKIEAGNTNLFVSGWRPALGWICVFAVGYAYIGYPLFTWIAGVINPAFRIPALEVDSLMQLILGMLGLGSLRTYEKIKGVTK